MSGAPRHRRNVFHTGRASSTPSWTIFPKSSEPRTRHAHRALADGAPHHVRALEAWVHLFPFREAHTHTCIAPHGLYRSGEYDDEASELRHRRERLLTLRQKRADASEGV